MSSRYNKTKCTKPIFDVPLKRGKMDSNVLIFFELKTYMDQVYSYKMKSTTRNV